MPEAAAAFPFAPPIRRTDYLVRRPASAWLELLAAGLGEAGDRGDAEGLSVVLNNLAFLLFKGGLTDAAARLCRAHYRRYAASPRGATAQLAVQPWINEGRLLLRRGDCAGARLRLLFDPRADGIVVEGTRLSPLAEATRSVCRNVAVADGFVLALREAGLDGARRHLALLHRAGSSGTPLAELRLQLALARGRLGLADAIAATLFRSDPYLPTRACCGALLALHAGDRRRFARDTLLLVALLDGWAAGDDDTASILHALLWLDRIGGDSYRAVVAPATQGFLQRRAVLLDDEEVRSRLAGRPYDPLPRASPARRAAVELADAALASLARADLAI